MSTLAPPVAEPSHAVLEQAAEWYACLRDGRASAAERAAWQAWLQASAEHAAAWRYVEDISRSFEPARGVPDPRRTAGQLCEANERLVARRRVLSSVAVLAGAGVFGWLAWRKTGWAGDLAAWSADQRTGVGEQRDLTLADGTRLWLNTASAIDVRFSAQERRIVLLAGELFIETAHETARPFLVDTAHGRMRALGTRFNVRLGDGTTRLSVYEGAVEVRTAAGGDTSVVAAGKRVEFADGALGAATAADIAGEAWTEGTLVAERITLRELVQELRRYRKGHLGVADEVADLSVYGNFPVRDTDRVLRMLASTLPIRIEQPWSWWTRIEARR